MNKKVDQQSADNIRALAVAMVEKANSGHPGLPMGTAAMTYTLWTEHLKHNPRNPDWPDRHLMGWHDGAALGLTRNSTAHPGNETLLR